MSGKIFIIMILILSAAACRENAMITGFDQGDVEKASFVYKKYGGWINYHLVYVDTTGSIDYYELSHASLDTILVVRDSLIRDELSLINYLTRNMSDYKSFYEPEKYFTDGNYHQIIRQKDAAADTIRVYEPGRVKMPYKLINMIQFFENKITELRKKV